MSDTTAAGSLSLRATGPLGEGHVQQNLLDNIHAMMQALADEGREFIVEGLAGGEQGRDEIAALHDRVSAHYQGRAYAVQNRGRWVFHSKVSPYNVGFSRAEGISLMAAASELEGRYHYARQAAARMRSSAKVARADLMKGIG